MPYNADLFIKKLEDEEISWTVYLNPISHDLWVMLVIVSLTIAFVLSIIEKHSEKFNQNPMFQLNNFLVPSLAKSMFMTVLFSSLLQKILMSDK